MKIKVMALGVMASLLAIGSAALATIVIDTVPVADSENVADTRYVTPGYGAVGYEYRIGKYEVTAGQYTEFLNAVAKADTYGLYNVAMWSSSYGCKIQQSYADGVGYSYTVAPGYENRPVNWVSYWDSCRFANWLHNGQQGAGTTETGAYTMTTGGMNANTIDRNGNWKWAVTSEDEWYKAAYYKGGSTNAGYFNYPTSSDSAPTSESPPGGDNNSANFHDALAYTTAVGSYTGSDSPYGTFDQGGNVWEWNEAVISDQFGSYRGLKGVAFKFDGGDMHASYRSGSSGYPTTENDFLGFRVVEIPEPATMVVLALGGIGMLVRRKGV